MNVEKVFFFINKEPFLLGLANTANWLEKKGKTFLNIIPEYP